MGIVYLFRKSIWLNSLKDCIVAAFWLKGYFDSKNAFNLSIRN